jgi:hypothetical protein
MLLRAHELITDRIAGIDVDLPPAGCVVAQRHQTPTVVVARQVQHDRSQVRRRTVDRVDLAGVLGQAEERLLHDVFSGVAIVDEQTRQAHQRTTLGTEEAQDEILSFDTDRFVLQPRRDRSPQRPGHTGCGRRDRDDVHSVPKLVTKSAAVVTYRQTIEVTIRVTRISNACHPSGVGPSSVGTMIALESNTGRRQVDHITENMRVLIVAGIPAGALVVGFGSRIAMFVLRLTSPDRVIGVRSDDDFVIGKVTLGGTYNLLQLGAAVGIIGAGVYLLVAPWLIGPLWFRRLTTGLASAVVAGSMLVHDDGIDFHALQPTWLAIGLFVLLPGLFGIAIAAAVDAVRRPDSWTTGGRRRWVLAIVSVACFPATLLVLAVAVVLTVFGEMLHATGFVRWVHSISFHALVIRALWLLAAIAGLVALVNDVAAII